MSSGTLLEVEHLSMSFGGVRAVEDLSFRVGKAEIVAIIGPNGAGKTTVFNCLSGFYRPPVGRMELNHDDGSRFLLERMEAFRIASEAKLARTFQNVRLFSSMSALENLVIAQHEQTKAADSTGWGCLRPPTSAPARSPLARSAGWRSRARCAHRPFSSVSTSPRPA